MENNFTNQENVKEISLRDILEIVKKNIILIIAVVLLFTAGGVVYSMVKEPSYTVNQKLVFTCENTGGYYNASGSFVSANTTQNNFNTMTAYGETIKDLFDTGVVIDRANYNYTQYLNAKSEGKVATVNEYITNLSAVADAYTAPTEASKNEYITVNNISIGALSTEEYLFAFMVGYTDSDKQEASDKLDILIYSYIKECETEVSGNIKYFGQFRVDMSDMGTQSLVSNVSKVKTTLIFFVIGVVVAAIIVCVVTLLDNTVKTKEDLERITGASLLAKVTDRG